MRRHRPRCAARYRGTGAALVAGGLLAHAVWDAVLRRSGRVISRSFAEWCGVYDVVVGIGLLALLVA